MATRYWVGGSGTWDTTTTTNWSATSGGSGGASAPTSSDDVVIDGNSGSGTITIVSGAVCAAFTYSSAATITCSGYVQVYGAFVMDRNASSALNTMQVGLRGSSIRGSVGSYIEQVQFINATTTLSGNVYARYVFVSGVTVNLAGYALYVNSTNFSSGTVSNGSIYFTPLNSTYYQLYIRAVWASVTLYVETGTYAPLVDVSYASSAADLGDIVFNSSATATVDHLEAKNITANSGILSNAVLSIYCYGNFYLASTATISASLLGKVYLYKVAGSPTTTRTLRIDGDASKVTVEIDAGTDTTNITGDGNGLGSNTYPVGDVKVYSPANFSCTTIYAGSLYVDSSVACDISALTALNLWSFQNFSIGLVPGSCAINIKNYLAYGFGQYRSSGVTIASVTVVDAIALRFYGNNTIGTLTCSTSLGQGSTRGLEFNPGSTQTVTGTFTLSGASASDTVYLTIIGSGSAATISKASGTVNANYAVISYSNATGGALFKAPLTTNVNGGNNTGWIFTAAGGGANFFTFF